MKELFESLARIRGDFAARLPKMLEDLDKSVKVLASEPDDADALETIRSISHRLSGSAGTFGFDALGNAATELEVSVCARLAEPGSKDGSVAEIEDRAERVILSVRQKARQHKSPIPTPVPVAQKSATERLVFLAEDDADLRNHLDTLLGQFGYKVRAFPAPEPMLKALATETPSVIVTDISFDNDDMGGLEVVHRLRATGYTDLPVVFISARADFENRLQAVRGGASAYLVKPVDSNALLDQLDELAGSREEKPIGIMVIDDDERLGSYFCAVLGATGMHTRLITDPANALSEIADFGPDVILLDLHMPECTGAELAAVIRQQDALAGIPIVYLSAESDLKMRRTAMEVGGDGFLTKPINDELLIAVARSRARRSRDLRALMTRDGLTGLLNHAAVMERLDVEIARATREEKPLSVALIDVDRFKAVNDTYGHLRGDQVLKALGRLLMQRFRKTDLVGRYGGEEFIVILPGADATIASAIVDELRTGFATVEHKSDSAPFTVTFSCGISHYPSNQTKRLLLEIADKALYEAKRSGRNKVVTA